MTGRLRVLIVDDHPGIRRSVSRLLSCRHDVVGCIVDGSGLLEAVQQLAPDVIVLDLNLPGIGGLEICAQVSQHHPEVDVIVFTAAEDPEVRSQAFEAGASAFVNKLATDEDLLATIERLRADQD